MVTITVNTEYLTHQWIIEKDTMTFTATFHAESGDKILRTETTSRNPARLADELIDELKQFFPDVFKEACKLLKK